MKGRVSIATLMAVVLVAAVGIAALRSGSPTWADGVFSLTLFVLFVAILGGCWGRGPVRAAWAGFALFGWGYLILSFGPWSSDQIRPHLLTSTGLESLMPLMIPASKAADGFYSTGAHTIRLGSHEPFQQAGHALFAIIFGGVGSATARLFAARRDLRPGTAPPPDRADAGPSR